MPDCDRKTAYSSRRTFYFLRPMLNLIERFICELTERQRCDGAKPRHSHRETLISRVSRPIPPGNATLMVITAPSRPTISAPVTCETGLP